MHSSVRDILFLGMVMTILAGFSTMVGMWVARVAARQRVAENLLRERLARAWGVNAAPRTGEPEAH